MITHSIGSVVERGFYMTLVGESHNRRFDNNHQKCIYPLTYQSLFWEFIL